MSQQQTGEQPDEKSPLEWLDWVGVVARTLKLTATESAVLAKLARHANRTGLTKPGIALIAEFVRRGQSTVSRALARLRELGVVQTVRQGGPGVPAVRRLVADATSWVNHQLSLFDVPKSSSQAGPSKASTSPAAPPSAAGPERSGTPSPLTSAPKPSHQRETEGDRKGQVLQENAGEHECLSPSLPKVLHVLAEVSHLVAVDDMCVDRALRLHPELDHLAAAEEVVIGALAGWRRPASMSLLNLLRRQQRDRAVCEARRRRPGRGRRRAASQQDPRVEAKYAALDLPAAEPVDVATKYAALDLPTFDELYGHLDLDGTPVS